VIVITVVRAKTVVTTMQGVRMAGVYAIRAMAIVITVGVMVVRVTCQLIKIIVLDVEYDATGQQNTMRNV
jgi:hypothetical protein